MLVEIKWHDKTHRTVFCQIEGEWSYSGYNNTYSQLIQYSRQVSEKINLICDMTKAESLVEDTKLLQVSPLIHHAAIITDNINHPAVKQLETILHAQNPAVLVSHAPNVNSAMTRIRRIASVGT